MKEFLASRFSQIPSNFGSTAVLLLQLNKMAAAKADTKRKSRRKARTEGGPDDHKTTVSAANAGYASLLTVII